MTTLSDAQVIGYAKGAGFTGTNAVTACAVAHAESGCRTDAHNVSNRDGTQDYGLMQINSSHASLLSSGNWQDPADNMRMAYSVFQSQGWHAWSTYNSGAYLPFMAQAFAASGAQPLKTTKATAPPNAPYPAGSLKAPLTPQQKIAVLAYLKPTWTAATQPTWTQFTAYSDGAIINTYNQVASAGQVMTGDPGYVTPGVGPLPSIGPDLSGIASFVKFVTSGSTYIRAAEFITGIALLFLGIFGIQRVTSAIKHAGTTAAKAAALA